MSLAVMDTQAEIEKILEEEKCKVAEHISA